MAGFCSKHKEYKSDCHICQTVYQIQNDYEKDFYEILLDTGEKVVCWPNTGFYNALENTSEEQEQRQWPINKTKARKLSEEESNFFIFKDIK